MPATISPPRREEPEVQVRDLRDLHEATLRVARTTELNSALREILQSVLTAVGTDKGLLSLCTPQATDLTLAHSQGFTPEFQKFVQTVPSGEGVCGTAYQRGERVMLEEVETDPLFAAYRETARRGEFQACHSVPLCTRQGKILGVLTAHFRKPHPSSKRENQLMDLYAQMAADFIEHQQDIEAVRDREQQLHQIIALIPAGVYTCDARGRITFYNEAAATLWGRTPKIGEEQWCGSHRIYRPDGSPLPAAECPMALTLKEGRSVQGAEIMIERPDGTRRNVLPYPQPIRNAAGTIIGAVNTLVDITEHRKTETAAYQLAAIVESSEDAIVSKNLDGVVMSWNEGAERIFGYKAEEIIGQSITVLIPEERPNEESDILQRIQRGERIQHFETVRRCKNGRLLDVSLTVSPIKDASNRIVGASKIARDITERKKNEVQRKQAEADLQATQTRLEEYAQELEQRVEERTVSLQKAVEQMEEFSYSVSHDLRAPVRAMYGYAQALQEDYTDTLDQQAKDYLQRIVRAGQRMDRLIQDLLTYTRLSRHPMEFNPVNLDILLQEIIQNYPTMHSPRAELVIRKPLPWVLAHEPSLSQAISNLLVNAIKFIQPGQTPQIEVWAEKKDSEVRLLIRDHGIGIKPEHQHRLFGMFERVVSEADYEGTGIGLAIVRKAMERMNGKVGVISDGTTGSTFWLQLPGPPPPEVSMSSE